MSNITTDSQVALMTCWENEIIIHAGLRKEITTMCLSVHQGRSICEKKQEYVFERVPAGQITHVKLLKPSQEKMTQ